MALETGLTYTSNLKVQEQHLAVNAGSGDLRVLATPMMMALMENAAMMAVASDIMFLRQLNLSRLKVANSSSVFLLRTKMALLARENI